MRTEYVVLLIVAALSVAGWGIRAFWKFTNELTEWRVKIFDADKGLIKQVERLDGRVSTIEKRLGWEGEFGRRATDNP
jgi:hypothetical protein